MSATPSPREKSVLDPIDRTTQIVYGVIMILTFTLTFNAATAGRAEMRTLLLAALSCTLAWGIVDATIYLVARLMERGREAKILRALRISADADATGCAIKEAFPEPLAAILQPKDLEGIVQKIRSLPDAAVDTRLSRRDYLGAIAVGFFLIAGTFPLSVPFMVMEDARSALRTSHGIAIAMLLFSGYSLGRHAGHPPWQMAVVMVGVGIILIAVTLALGG